MFGFKKKRHTPNFEIGSEVWFFGTERRLPCICSGIIHQIDLHQSGRIIYSVEPKNNSWIRRETKERFFKSKNECIDHWVNYLESQRDKE